MTPTTTKRISYSETAHDYVRRVVSGEQIASKWIKLACQRHLDDLNRRNSRWYFNSGKVERVCAFIETLALSDGSPFRLQPFQIWIVASLLGWMDDAGTRKYIEALILISKGNGKSPLAAALGLWFAFFDGRRKAEVYCGALSIAQAMEVFSPARDFVESQKAFAKLGVTAQKKSIFSRDGSRFVPVIGRGRHGARPYLAILDELHQAINADLYGTFKTGCNKTPNSLMLTISTAGVASSESPCYQLQLRAQKALDGSLPDDYMQYAGSRFNFNAPVYSTATTGGFITPLYTPASSAAACTTGTAAWDASYLYICKATNSWVRSPAVFTTW